MRHLSIGTVVVLLVGALAYVSLRTGPLAPVRVTIVQVKEGILSPSLFGVGTVEARRSWMVGPTIAGRVIKVGVDVGDFVKAGQLLAEMDPVDLDQRLSALDASLARAGSAQAAAQAQITDAMARRTLARANTQRNVDLAKQNFISPGALEARVQEQASAEAALVATQANLQGTAQDLLRLKAERAGLVQQRGTVRLLAPANGVITSRDAEAGSTVLAGQPVLRLIDPDSLWVKLRVDQGRSAGLVSGLKAEISMRSRPRMPLQGRVARIELLADSVTEERIAQVTFENLPSGLAIGEMAEVTLQLPSLQPALLIPNASIQHQGNTTGVWRLEKEYPVFAPVQLGTNDLQGQVQVLQGLHKDDQIVVYSQKALTSNSRIQVVDTLVKPVGAP